MPHDALAPRLGGAKKRHGKSVQGARLGAREDFTGDPAVVKVASVIREGPGGAGLHGAATGRPSRQLL